MHPRSSLPCFQRSKHRGAERGGASKNTITTQHKSPSQHKSQCTLNSEEKLHNQTCIKTAPLLELQHTHEALDMCFSEVRQQGRKTGLHTCSQHTAEENCSFRTTRPQHSQKQVSTSTKWGHLDRIWPSVKKNTLRFALSTVKRYIYVSLPCVNMDWNIRIVDVWHRMNPNVSFSVIIGKNIVLATVPCWHFSQSPVTWHASQCIRGLGSDSWLLIGCVTEARSKTRYVIG